VNTRNSENHTFSNKNRQQKDCNKMKLRQPTALAKTKAKPTEISPNIKCCCREPQNGDASNLINSFFFGFVATQLQRQKEWKQGKCSNREAQKHPARRHSRSSCHMCGGIVVCACSRHALDFKILFFRSFVTRKGYCVCVLLCFIKLILGNRLRSRCFLIGGPRSMHPVKLLIISMIFDKFVQSSSP